MSIFSKIKDAIFGTKAAAQPTAPANPSAANRTPSATTGATARSTWSRPSGESRKPGIASAASTAPAGGAAAG